jgi:hypothetical protein
LHLQNSPRVREHDIRRVDRTGAQRVDHRGQAVEDKSMSRRVSSKGFTIVSRE